MMEQGYNSAYWSQLPIHSYNHYILHQPHKFRCMSIAVSKAKQHMIFYLHWVLIQMGMLNIDNT